MTGNASTRGFNGKFPLKGTYAKYIRAHRAASNRKLIPEQVRAIRFAYIEGKSINKLAKEFDVSTVVINKIVRLETYLDVPLA